MSLKFYEDLSWFGKILYRLHLKRAISFSKKDLNKLVSATKFLDNCPREDFSFNAEIFRQCSKDEVDRKWQ